MWDVSDPVIVTHLAGNLSNTYQFVRGLKNKHLELYKRGKVFDFDTVCVRFSQDFFGDKRNCCY